MSDAYRTPARSVDETEIERAKIHEAAETKRKAIEEREKTNRIAIENRDTVGYVVPRICAAIIGLAVIIAAGSTASSYIESKGPVRPCVETVEIIVPSNDKRTCSPGARLETTKLDSEHVIWKCLCGTAPAADGGT